MAQPRDTGRTRAIPTTPPTTPAKPAPDALARLMAPGYESDDAWARRDATSKAMRTVDGVIPRLGGLSQICWGLSYRDMVSGAVTAAEAMHSPYSYLATALDDIARGLKAGHDLWWQEVDRDFDAKSRKRVKGGAA